MTRVTNLGSTGSRKIRSAKPGEVWIVAMFGLISQTSTPSSLSALIACEPE